MPGLANLAYLEVSMRILALHGVALTGSVDQKQRVFPAQLDQIWGQTSAVRGSKMVEIGYTGWT